MSKKIYKYLGPDVFPLVFQEEESVSIKFSFPKDYNDPFELFLSIDSSKTEPELLAFYRDIVQEIPQRPTTCFSKSPIVTPMWAHYASNLTGFVLEFDEDLLMDFVSDSYIKDVSYLEQTSSDVRSHLERAYHIGKPRHAMWLNQAADHIAYFNKHICWNYEQERRLVINTNDLDKLDENMLMYVPIECVTAIIAGARVSEDAYNKSIDLAGDIGCEHYGLFIGQSYKQPYFKNSSGNSYVFDGENITGAASYCDNCQEPIEVPSQDLCAWCAIDDIHKEDAMIRNPLRVLHRAGNLDKYIQDFNSIGKK
ncbi:DUF2971 domain-containing protein [Vibrio parahaemolyticus]|nr:DUF2971 domain-containing protein [Vibrio parahaemolyticus]EJG0994255.1 DUF2971 domain-containing protein [Vibrio parahaemolyticus]EJG1003840.1 DUF2971 domain-containing protein [Vibrio parahaemolyticus]EJG1052106.1 DUF2971 domain-containing protein [Vibrio parahaemolyticus]HCD1298730.1 DUF2971 domain-containing protein [Vibrio parahaemolyticus]